MNKTKILYIVALVVVFMSGIYIGNELHYRNINNINRLYEHTTVTNLRIKVKVLTLIRNDRIEQCERMLEFLVDNDISYFNTVMKTRKYSHEADAEILEAIAEAKRYREQYPYHTPREDFAANINEAFQRIPTTSR